MGFVVEDGTLTRYTGNEKDIVIPEGITRLGAGVFKDSDLHSVVIGAQVEEIGAECFKDCRLLEYVDISQSAVKMISEMTFYRCDSLREVKFPKLLYEVGVSAFENCTALEAAILPTSVQKLNTNSFKNCRGLKKLSFGAAHRSSSWFAAMDIEAEAFCGCSSLESVEFHDMTKNIGKKAFKHCTSLKDISFVDFSDCSVAVSAFDDTAFINDHEGEYIVFGGGFVYKYIGKASELTVTESVIQCHKAVYSNSGIHSVVYDKNCSCAGGFMECKDLVRAEINSKIVESFAFYECENLSEVVLGDGVESICTDAFSGCPSLEYIRIPASLNRISSLAFSDNSLNFTLEIDSSSASAVRAVADACDNLRAIYAPNVCIFELAPSNQYSKEIRHLAMLGFVEMVQQGRELPSRVVTYNEDYIRKFITAARKFAVSSIDMLQYLYSRELLGLSDIDKLIDECKGDVVKTALLLDFRRKLNSDNSDYQL